MSRNRLLTIKDLSVGFQTEEGFVSAIQGVNLSLAPGEIMGLVGESGSGKSVTALTVMRLLSKTAGRVTSGEVLFNHPDKGAIDLLTINEQQMQHVRGCDISMIFQEPMTSLNPVKRCGPQVVEGLLWHGRATRREARQKALALFEEARLPEPEKVYHAWPHELSGGQKQRVMIAMAMACDPALLIADEPTTALDVSVQKHILSLIKSLRDSHGMAVLFISHDLGVIREIADTASVMHQGKIVEQGRVEAIFSEPEEPYTKALIACRPPTSHRPERLAVVDDFLSTDASGREMAITDTSNRTLADGQQPAWRHSGDHSSPLLVVDNLSAHYITKRNLLGRVLGYHKAVDNISFTLYQGETLGLVGESGCGKTTLGRTIMQLLRQNSGKIVYKGQDLSQLSRNALRKRRPAFQIIFQDPYASLTPGIHIGNAIMEPMQVHGILQNKKQRKERTMELLSRVGLEESHYYRYPHEFSGGQRQRIAIARALALDPEFIICDEAVSALDVSVQARILNLLNELKQSFGLTYLFISHDLSVVKYMSDRIIVMQDGQMVELNDADRLYHFPGSDYTRQLIDAVPE